MSFFKTILLFYFGFILTTTSIAQHTIDEGLLSRLYNNGQYKELYAKACEYRKKPYSTTFMIDFYIAISSCMLNYPSQSDEWFKHILQNYSLDAQNKSYVLNAQQACVAQRKPTTMSGATTNNHNTISENSMRPTAGVSGKTMYSSDYEYVEQPNVEVVSIIPQAEISSRILTRTNTGLVDAKIATLRKTYYTQPNGPFIFLSDVPISNNSITNITNKLITAYTFFQKKYTANPSPYYLYVFIGSTKTALNNFALNYHGLKLPPQMYGYTQVDDLCLAGVANEQYIGTLFHELFHLTIRNSYGDVFPFIDEGVAALYEATTIDSYGNLKGVNNWRKDVILDNINSLPSIYDLTQMNWEEFRGNRGSNAFRLTTQAKNEATARYFMLYLQEKGLLDKMVNGMRLLTIANFPEKTNATLLAARPYLIGNLFNTDIETVNANFQSWLRTYLNVTNQSNYEGQQQMQQTQQMPQLQQQKSSNIK